ncbi:MAG: prephenate dehydratase [Desulfobacterales bacterium]|nr:prephenate dehydratase [Desulfobacterales bacterium]
MDKTENTGDKALPGTIPELRQSIDSIDDEILSLINRRLSLALKIGKLKATNGNQVIDTTRESSIINRLVKQNAGPLDNRVLHHMYSEIMAASRELQRPQHIAFLGPEATFTHIAAMNHFGHSVTFSPQASIRDIFYEVEKGTFHYGVVPVENSIEGSVNYTLDLFFESGLKVCAEIYQSISHDLLSNETRLEDINTIYSHPHAFAQCRHWLRKNLPTVTLAECSSTAHAAQLASEQKGAAAIASKEAAQIYEIEIMADAIEDLSRNITRFLVIGKDKIGPTGNDKTSIMFATGHVPGALYKALKPLADSGVNMDKLESRPAKHENWNYFFFVDIEGHIDDPNVSKTFEQMEKICTFIKCLGSYPREKNS